MNRNRVFLVIAIVGFAGIVLLLSSLDNRQSTNNPQDANAITGETIRTGITVEVVPTFDTNITINGKGVTEGTTELEPGAYTVTASRSGFKTESRTVTLTEGDRITIGFILTSNSPETADYYEKNPSEARKAEGITGQKSEATASAKVHALPLLKRLPREERGRYLITYGQSLKKPDDPAAAVIYIEYKDEAAKTTAENWIRYQGYDPKNLEIQYKLNPARWQ